MEFASQVVILRGVVEGGFSKNTVFSAGGRRVRERNSTHHIKFSYHMEVRTLNARRMFREKLLADRIRKLEAPFFSKKVGCIYKEREVVCAPA